jgi:hypothetical protein
MGEEKKYVKEAEDEGEALKDNKKRQENYMEVNKEIEEEKMKGRIREEEQEKKNQQYEFLTHLVLKVSHYLILDSKQTINVIPTSNVSANELI